MSAVSLLFLLLAVLWWSITSGVPVSVPLRCPNIQRLKYGNDYFKFSMYPPHPEMYLALVRSKGKIHSERSLYLSIAARGEDKFVIHQLCVRTRDVSQIHLVYEGWVPPHPVTANHTAKVTNPRARYQRAFVPTMAWERIYVYTPHVLTTSCVRSRGVNNKIHIDLLKVKGASDIQVKDVKLAACLM